MMTASPFFILLAVCTITGWMDINVPAAVTARRSNTLSYWTQKQPCNRMEWNVLPAVIISARPCPNSTIRSSALVESPSSADKKVKVKYNADDHDDHYDLVVFGCVTPSSTSSASSSTTAVVKNSTASATAVAKNVTAADVTVSGTSQEKSECESEITRLLSWLHSKGITEDLVQSLQSEISDSTAAGTMSGVAYIYSRINITTNGTADTAISTDATPRLQRLVCLSLGQKEQPAGSRAADARRAGTALAALVGSNKEGKKGGSQINSCALFLPTVAGMDEEYITEVVTALYVGLYRDERFKSRTDKNGDNGSFSASNTLQRIDLMYDDDDDDTSTAAINWERAVKRARILAEGVYLAKDIVNAPHNVLNSLALAETAQRLAQQHGSRLTCQVLSAEECEELGMGAFLGVARGSETPAQFLHLTYTPPRQRQHWWSWGQKQPRQKDCKRLGIVGKGLLFDTGGYNIKTQMMELMKFDCGGAAAVLGAARAIAQLEPEDVEIHFVVAACENMINEKAMVPGDILSASNGKTIEVMNTDAEGRLTMADALVYVDQTLQCDEIVELSTLTGACVVALGSSIAGLWTNSDTLAASLLTASATTGEKIWRMPMEQEYKEDLKSKIADLKNLGGRNGGAIAAALFLQEFVKGDKPFAHVDIAGPVWNAKAGEATGYGAKLVTEWACQSRL
jgi:leucyl aminopeptidase